MNKKLTAIYARVSSAQQKEDETIDSQVDILLKYAQENQFEIPLGWIFKDEGYSGFNLDRPGLDALRDLVEDGSIDNILVSSTDRLSRHYVNLLILEEEFSKYAVKVIYINGSKSNSPEDALIKHFQGIFAEYERSQILDRSRRGKLYKARQGNKNIFSVAPYGYNNTRNDFYSINEEQALVVREIFRLYTKEGLSLISVATHLDKKGVTPPKGGDMWSTTTLREILSNTSFIGTAYYGKTEKGVSKNEKIIRYTHLGKVTKVKKSTRNRAKDDWIPIPVPAIINESDFEIAQELLKRNRELAKRNTKYPSILQGLLVCGHCSRSFYKKSQGKKRIASYYCHSQLSKGIKWCGNPKIDQSQLDSIVWENVLELINNPQFIEEEIQRRIDENPCKKIHEDREKEIEKEIKRLKIAQDKLLDAYQELEHFSINELKTRLQKLRELENSLKKELDALRAFSIMNEKRENLQITIEEFRQRLGENSADLSVVEKQKIVRSLVEEIIVMPGEITINHTIPLNQKKRNQLHKRLQKLVNCINPLQRDIYR